MEKVFSTKQMVTTSLNTLTESNKPLKISALTSALLSGWCEVLEGKTKDEIHQLGYETIDEWMVDKDKYNPYDN